jgi:hypothetical protein
MFHSLFSSGSRAKKKGATDGLVIAWTHAYLSLFILFVYLLCIYPDLNIKNNPNDMS